MVVFVCKAVLQWPIVYAHVFGEVVATLCQIDVLEPVAQLFEVVSNSTWHAVVTYESLQSHG